MFRLQKKSLFFISGMTWALIGILLLKKGIYFLIIPQNELPETQLKPLLTNLGPYFVSFEQAALFLIVFALFVGHLKGKFVLRKSATRVIDRIEHLREPIALKEVYSPMYLVLIAFMMFLGFSMNYLNIPVDVRGFIDVAIGSALIKGSLYYFNHTSEKTTSKNSFL